MKCDKIIEIPNMQAVHGLRVQKYPRTGYIFANGEDGIPLPNDGKILDEPGQYHSIFTAIDGDTMKIAWQVMVDGNLDNVDADFQGKRSEEHTSDIQSLMRISYAVICLKKKK